SFFEDNFVPE
nr:Chain P, AMPHIPHYSIN [synthetic construct]